METTEDSSLREKAIKRLKQKREFSAHLLAFIVVNAFLVILWATVAERGFFWPMFPILGWGIGLLFHGWDVYRGTPSEEEIRKEMQKMQ
ncbi:MAG TPA: 2TM domain-containing protein [Dehalococcoidia bacterium]|nr:2TM domain-containing protein [Dehalococcoidia bacterium]